jgi:hypothetical protein
MNPSRFPCGSLCSTCDPTSALLFKTTPLENESAQLSVRKIHLNFNSLPTTGSRTSTSYQNNRGLAIRRTVGSLVEHLVRDTVEIH